jgi:hypothetical protein
MSVHFSVDQNFTEKHRIYLVSVGHVDRTEFVISDRSDIDNERFNAVHRFAAKFEKKNARGLSSVILRVVSVDRRAPGSFEVHRSQRAAK